MTQCDGGIDAQARGAGTMLATTATRAARGTALEIGLSSLNNPVLFRGLPSSLIVRIPVMQVATFASFVNAFECAQQGIFISGVDRLHCYVRRIPEPLCAASEVRTVGVHQHLNLFRLAFDLGIL